MLNRLNISDLSDLNGFQKNDVKLLDDDVMLIDNFTNFSGDMGPFQLNMIVIVFCYAGRVQVKINGRDFLVEKDSLLLCNNLHTLADAMFSSDFVSFIMAISLKRLETLLSVYKQSIQSLFLLNDNPVIKLLPEEIPLIQHYRELLDAKYNMPRHEMFAKALDCLLQSALYDLVGICNRVLRHRQLNNASSSVRTTNVLVQRFLMLLADNIVHHRTVDYFADKLCVTPKYLSSLCKKETGKVASAWIHELLVERIRYLLVSSSMSCKEISAQFDFPNTSFFCKYVKKHLGCSPLAYRKKHQ